MYELFTKSIASKHANACYYFQSPQPVCSSMNITRKVMFRDVMSALVSVMALSLPLQVMPVYASTSGLTLSVFSTFPSEALTAACGKTLHNDQAVCTEDALAPEQFITALQTNVPFNAILPFEDAADYSLLVANLGQTLASSPEEKQLTEFTLQWRGLEIDSFTVIKENTQDTESHAIANDMVDAWYRYVETNNVFTCLLYTSPSPRDRG